MEGIHKQMHLLSRPSSCTTSSLGPIHSDILRDELRRIPAILPNSCINSSPSISTTNLRDSPRVLGMT